MAEEFEITAEMKAHADKVLSKIPKAPRPFPMSSTDKPDELTARDASLLFFYKSIESDLQRIIGLVQNNREFFGAKLGQCCVKAAADKLETLVKERKS